MAAMDGIALAEVAAELRVKLVGSRVNRVYQPDPHVVTLAFYGRGEDHLLLISCHPQGTRLHLTWRRRPNPPVPSPFCMLLRKHLEGGRLAAVEQAGLDRVLTLVVEGTDELGRQVRRRLVAELTGKYANLVLVDGEGRILDALKRLPAAVNRHREVLPGRVYVPPPETGKLPLLDPDLSHRLTAAWRDAGDATAPGREGPGGPPQGLPAWRRLLALVEGPGPDTARRLLRLAGADPEGPAAGISPAQLEALVQRLSDLARRLASGPAAPGPGEPGPAAPGPAEPSPSQALDTHWQGIEDATALEAGRLRLTQVLRRALERARRRLSAQEGERQEALEADALQSAGEILMAYLHTLRPGLQEVRLPDFYDPAGGERRIALDPRLGPAANAQAYFRRAQKARRAREVAGEKVARSQEEIAYLEGVELALESATNGDDLAAISAELAGEGYLAAEPRQKGTGRGGNRKPSRPGGGQPRVQGTGQPSAGQPLAFRSSEGITILVGKNNRQNDLLTLRQASPGDIWLHTRQIPGSHVIIRWPGPAPAHLEAIPRRTLEEAACLAAFHSRARRSSKVPVDYTFRRHVHKPRGARPGFVHYTDFRTIIVTPDEEAVRRLASANGNRPQTAGAAPPIFPS